MTKIRLKSETRIALEQSGFYLGSCWQPPLSDGRKLRDVPEPGDPWVAQLWYPEEPSKPCRWFARFIQWGEGDTADEAVRNALDKAQGLEGRYRHLEAVIGELVETLHVTRTGASYTGT